MANPLKILTALSASSGVAVSGSDGLKVQQGGLTIDSGDLKLSSAGLIKNSSGTTVITVDGSGNTTVNGALKLGDDRIRGSAGSDLIITTNNEVKINSGGLQVTGSTTTSGSLTVGGNGELSAGTASLGGLTVSTNGIVVSAGGANITGQLTANTGLVVNNSALLVSGGGISGSSTLQVGGASTLVGAVEARNGLTVTGSVTATSALSASAISASSYIGNGSGLTSLTASQISNFTSDVRGQFSNGTGVTITNGSVAIGQAVGTTDNVTFNTVTASNAVFQTASIGVLNYVSGNAIQLGDKYVTIASGASDHTSLDGSGFLWGSGAVGATHASILYRATGDLLEISPNLSSSNISASGDVNIAAGKSYKINSSDVLSSASVSTTYSDISGTIVYSPNANSIIGLGQISSSLLEIVSSNSMYVSGTSLLTVNSDAHIIGLAGAGQTAVELNAIGGGNVFIKGTGVKLQNESGGYVLLEGDPFIQYDGSEFNAYPITRSIEGSNYLSLTGALSAALGGGGGGGVSEAAVTGAIDNATSSVKTATTDSYKQLRVFGKGLIQTGSSPANRVTFLLSGSSTTTENTGSNVLKGLYGMSDANALTLLQTRVGALSFDVALYDGGSQSWTNDLVSVYITASQGDSGSLFYPKFVIDAPGASDGTEIRLIVVNENPEDFDIV